MMQVEMSPRGPEQVMNLIYALDEAGFTTSYHRADGDVYGDDVVEGFYAVLGETEVEFYVNPSLLRDWAGDHADYEDMKNYVRSIQ